MHATTHTCLTLAVHNSTTEVHSVLNRFSQVVGIAPWGLSGLINDTAAPSNAATTPAQADTLQLALANWPASWVQVRSLGSLIPCSQHLLGHDQLINLPRKFLLLLLLLAEPFEIPLWLLLERCHAPGRSSHKETSTTLLNASVYVQDTCSPGG